ncbi:MAG: DegV family protein [Anaerolineae bacterium]|jgi:DegV family protein with EDD domain
MNQHRVALITDSTCDIPEDLIEQYDITVVPLHVIWGNETFRDRIDLQPKAFYRRLTEDPRYPTTAHPTPEGFLATYQATIDKGASEIVVITLSSELSGAFGAASQASTMIESPVHVFDSKGTTMSLGWQVLAAARARQAGGDPSTGSGQAQTMIRAADEVRRRVALYVSLDTLEYLHKGGRIGGAAMFIGSLLNLKPLVYVDHETGRVEAAGRVRTRKRGLDTLYERFSEALRVPEGTHDGAMHIAVMHGDAPQDAQTIIERIERKYPRAELLTDITGPVLGVHTGPRAIALCGYAEG